MGGVQGSRTEKFYLMGNAVTCGDARAHDAAVKSHSDKTNVVWAPENSKRACYGAHWLDLEDPAQDVNSHKQYGAPHKYPGVVMDWISGKRRDVANIEQFHTRWEDE